MPFPFLALGIEHPTEATQELVHLEDPLGRRAPLERYGKAVEVELDAVTAVPSDGLPDQQEHVVPDFLVTVYRACDLGRDRNCETPCEFARSVFRGGARHGRR